MKKFNDNEQIAVYSDNSSPIYFPTKYKPDGYELPAVTDYSNPPFITLNYSEVRVLNNSSNAIRIGKIRFDKEIEAEIYQNLGIDNWKNIWTLEEIENIVKSHNHSAETYKRILDIKDKEEFERIRSVAVSLKNTNSYDISSRLLKTLEDRLTEFNKGLINSGIQVQQITPVQPANTVSQDEFNALKTQNEQMLAQMQALMAQLQQNAQVQVVTAVVEPKQEPIKPTQTQQTQKKTAGRPPKTK